MEAMARPMNQWHHEPSGAPKQSSFPDFKPGLDDCRIPRMSTPPRFPLKLPSPQISSLRRDSVHSSHVSTPSPLERSPPGPPAFFDAHHLSGTPQGAYHDYRSSSVHSSPALNGRPESNLVRTRQLSEVSSSAGQYVLARTPQLTSLLSSQSGSYVPGPQTPGPNQSPQQRSQATTPSESQAQSPRHQPRNNNMAVHALLNDEVTPCVLPAKAASPGRHDEMKYELSLRQQPVNARSCGFGDRDRRVVDPPPIIQLKIHAPGLSREEIGMKLRHPMNIVHCSIWSESGAEEMSGMPDEYTRQKRLMGNLVASPFVGVDEHGQEGCFFCFPDISCRTPGKYRLKFSLIALDSRPGAKSPVKVEVLSDIFQTFSAKEFPGMSESSALAKTLKQQGCNIPTKKGNEKGGKRDDSDDCSDEDELPRRKRVKNNQ